MTSSYDAIVIGASAGCVEALSQILPALPESYPLPVMVVVHLPPNKDSVMASLLATKCKMKVCEANDKEPVKPGHIYFAPPDYHMLTEHNDFLSLSNEEEILFSRPSIDVLFESAADVYAHSLVAVILTGANNDGAEGMARIAERGGLCLVQDPKTAYASAMPEAALKLSPSAKAMDIAGITQALLDIGAHKTRTLAEKPQEPNKILVVDDDALSAQTISWMLETLGYRTLMAHNGKSAIDIARKEKPKVILLDITLPDINGFDICRILKSDPHMEGVFIAAQTGWSDESDKKRAFAEGFDEYLIKPVSLDDYAGLLMTALQS
jgi:two-component system chemotaxis response regulator CheB